jgi:enoyl-CoA hydratase/carnithine racemase
LIHSYTKPLLCWADGITMGGGIGIMNGASYRIVTEHTVMAMPEIAIGFFPDVGGTHFLNRAGGLVFFSA